MTNVKSEGPKTPSPLATPPLKNPKATLPLGPIDPNPPAKVYDTGGTIGRYVIDGLIGRGGMANIFLATDPTTQYQVAIKIMPYQFNMDTAMRARFQREARVISALEHASVVPVYEVGEDNEQLYIVMRYMAGGSLAQRMQEAIPHEEIIQIGWQIAAALDEVHNQGIVHRDLKPDNILFDAEGNAYLSDFGIVKLAESTTIQTATGMTAGTPTYMSPEQIEAKVDLDGRSDVYALAIILFEMLSGRAPYIADTPIGLVTQHLFEPVPQIRTLDPDLPLVTQGVIERGLAKDREERYQTASELMDELEAALAGRLLEVRKVKSAAGRTGTQNVVEGRRRTPIWVWFTGVLGIGGIIALLLLFSQTFNNPVDSELTATPWVIYMDGTPMVITATPDGSAVLGSGTEEETIEADEPTPTASPTRGTGATRVPPTATTRPTDPPSSNSGSNTAGSNDAGTSGGGSGANSGGAAGGTNSGGANAGGSNTGGANAGGANTDGANSGANSAGADNGSSNAGGANAGGANAGGADNTNPGGAASGANSSGANNTDSGAGGATSGANSSGANAGGSNAGGANAGGANTDGANTGGSNAGGANTDGNSNAGGANGSGNGNTNNGSNAGGANGSGNGNTNNGSNAGGANNGSGNGNTNNGSNAGGANNGSGNGNSNNGSNNGGGNGSNNGNSNNGGSTTSITDGVVSASTDAHLLSD